jgi:tetratricopeptide (TPR) repeat protein
LDAPPIAATSAPSSQIQTPSGDPISAADKGRLIGLFSAGRYRESAALARELIERLPHSGFAWKALGVSLKLQREPALEAMERAAQLLPQDAEAQYNFGVAQLEADRAEEAVASFRRALTLKPDSVDTHNDLGAALHRLGQLDEAVLSYRAALALAPERADVHLNLGYTLQQLRRPADALSSFRQALTLKRDFIDAHMAVCNALRELGRSQEALDGCRQLVNVRPDIAEAHGNLGALLLDLGQLEEALASYQNALRIKPDYAEAYHNLGLALRLLRRPTEAEGSCRQALAINPSLAAAWAVLGDIRADQGDFAEAEESFRRAVELDPDLPEGWAGLAQLRKMSADDAWWGDAALRLVAKPLSPRKEGLLRYAIGKYFDDVGKFDQAFANYRRANELGKQQRLPHDRDEIVQSIDRTLTSYDHERLAAAREFGLDSSLPVFVVGMPRSGTTLVEQILASHPAVIGAGELTFWNLVGASSPPFLGEGQVGAAARRAAAQEYLLLLELQSAKAQRIVDKMPANFLQLGLIHAAMPCARIIHVQRDPIDTCLSIYFQDLRATLSYANDLGDLAHYYAEYRRLMEHWRSVLPEHALMDVPYEHLVNDPETWVRKMLAFIGLPWDSRCLEFHRTERDVLTASRWQVRQRMNAASIGRWRHYQAHVGELRALVRE